MDSMWPWIANFLANTAVQIAGVSNMTGALVMGLLAAIIGLIAWRRVRRSKLTLVPLDQAISYIRHKSRWALEHKTDVQWFMTLQRDVHDALCLGSVTGYGRQAQIPGGLSNPMQRIPLEHWQNYRLEIFDGLAGNKTDNFSRHLGELGRGFYDIHFDREQMRGHWPPMTLVDRFHHKPLVLQT